MSSGKYGRERPYYRIKDALLKRIKSQLLSIADFTDNEDTTGYIDVSSTLPIGAIPIAWKAVTTSAFLNADVYTPVDGTTIAFVDGGANDDTITDSAEGFVLAGFETGDTIAITGATTAGNNTEYTITNVVAGTLTFATGSVTTAEAGIEGISFAGVSTATISVGVSGDLDRFSADTSQNVGAIGTVGANVLSADACDGIGSEQTIRVTVSEGSNFGELSAGAMVVNLYYLVT